MTRTLVGTPDEGGSRRARIIATAVVGGMTYYVAKNWRGVAKAAIVAAPPLIIPPLVRVADQPGHLKITYT
jgi:hypothetical protein